MEVFVPLFLAVLPYVFSGPVLPPPDSINTAFILVKRTDGTYEVESLLDNTRRCPLATEEDVNFYFYSRSNPNKAKRFNIKQVKSLESSSHFDTSKETLFIIHGWHNNYTSPVNELIKKAVLEKHNVNLFVVDWSPVTKENYITVFYNVPKVGKFVGEFMEYISATYNYSFSDMRVVGHSMGAHVAGVAGKYTNGSLDYIVGLDPAGPLFFLNSTSNRLAKNDAEYVQVIHTCGKLLGLHHSIGNADYYPNGGMYQLGCGLMEDLDGSCSHGRSYEYFAESIRNDDFIATECDSYDSFEDGTCNNNTKAKMGGFFINKEALGSFFLRTKNAMPYALGQED